MWICFTVNKKLIILHTISLFELTIYLSYSLQNNVFIAYILYDEIVTQGKTLNSLMFGISLKKEPRLN